MTYTVTWSLNATAGLTRIPAKAGDPDRIRQASDSIDQTLRRTPLDRGESRAGQDRAWYGDVLGVLYRVGPDTLTVLVLLVGPARRR